MAERTWTKNQLEAIYTRRSAGGESCNILVNAAAGSGKTAVLVERIIKRIIPDDENMSPCDITSLLVVTFTNAAAAEMKERISAALSEAAENARKTDDFVLIKHIKRQISLLHSADITTIDAFCMKIIRESFHLLGIDPDFKIADNAQLALIADEAAEELFDECYENENEDFLRLAAMYSDGRDESALLENILEIYDFTRALPDPDGWLSEASDMYLLKDGAEKCPWVISALSKKDRLVESALSGLKSALLYMAEYSCGECRDLGKFLLQNPPEEENEVFLNWGTCYGIVYNEYMNLKNALHADWDESCNILNSLYFDRWGRAASLRDKQKEIKDKDRKAYVKNLRDAAKKAAEGAREIIAVPLSELERQFKERVYPQAKSLSELVRLYGVKFSEKKAQKNVLDFSDTEHLALKLFSENDEVCELLREKYEEILMDEYQDSNGLQEAIFQKISRGNNMFTVGDMKQSIYRFRRSDPMLFKQKSDSFKNEEGAENRKIVLSANFRSRAEVLDSVNAVFERIMSREAGDIDYDEEQRLYNGNKSYEDVNFLKCGGYKSECYALASVPGAEDDDGESIDKAELEANFIAEKISELKKAGFSVRDKDGYRPLQNRDITILMSSYKNVADIYIAALNRYGIDCFAETGGYFDKNEIKMVLALLKTIQNPYQDIPLLGVLRSPAGGFSDDELARIRAGTSGYIYEAVAEFSEKDGECAKKCAAFLARLDRWRSYTKYMDSARLLWTLYEESGIYAFVGALYRGDEAQANLRLLFERAKQYEASGYKGLFNFIRYIKKLQGRQEDLPGAKLVGEGHDVVRIMTIHKSKGLEFPVVFLAGCGKKFLHREKRIPMHKELGFGLEEIDPDANYRMPTVAAAAVKAANFAESISEEERKLYVAMTRAKEKLIVTGVVPALNSGGGEDIKKAEARWDAMLPDGESVMSASDVSSASGFLDWIAPVARRAKEFWIYESVGYRSYFAPAQETQKEEYSDPDAFSVSDFKYPYENLKRVPSKVSVTALKKMKNGFDSFYNETELAQMPGFMKAEEPLTPARKGSALHLAMQKIAPADNINEEYICACIEKLKQDGDLDEAEAASIEAGKIIAFYKSDLGKRVIKSKNAVREAPFETEIPLSAFEGYEASKEKILLQGIIDCYFEEPDGIVLLDYKSDYYKSPREIADKYKDQIDSYSYALERITGKRVKEKYIYMFYGNDIAKI